MAEAIGVAVEDAHEEATRRLVKILREQYANHLTSLYTRDANLVSDSGAGVPLPDLDFIWWQAGPTVQQMSDLGHVNAFVGPSGDSELLSDYTKGTQSYVAQVATPYTAAITFGVALHEPVDESYAQGEVVSSPRELREEEVMLLRAKKYLGALKHVISKYGCRHFSIYTTQPIRDYPMIDSIRIGEGQEAPIAMVYYEFNLIQYQCFPLHADL